MGFLDKVKGNLNIQENVSKVTSKVSALQSNVKEKIDQRKSSDDEVPEQEQQEKGSRCWQ